MWNQCQIRKLYGSQNTHKHNANHLPLIDTITFFPEQLHSMSGKLQLLGLISSELNIYNFFNFQKSHSCCFLVVHSHVALILLSLYMGHWPGTWQSNLRVMDLQAFHTVKFFQYDFIMQWWKTKKRSDLTSSANDFSATTCMSKKKALDEQFVFDIRETNRGKGGTLEKNL